MENQSNLTKFKNNIFSNSNKDKIKLLRQDLKSRSEDKHKKFYKNFKVNKESQILLNTNNLRKFESLEEFRLKLKQHEANNKMTCKKKHQENKFNMTQNNPFFTTLNNNSNLNMSALNFNSTVRTTKDKNYFNFCHAYNMSGSNFLNQNSLNANLNNNFNTFNSSLKSEFAEYIPRNIRTANISLQGLSKNIGNKNEVIKPQIIDFGIETLKNINKNGNCKDAQKNITKKNSNNVNINNNKKTENAEDNNQAYIEEKTLGPESGKKTNFFKTNNTNNIIKNYHAESLIVDKEVNDLLSYIMSNKELEIHENQRNVDILKLQELFDKLNMKNFIDPEEERKILEYLKRNKNVLDTSSLYNTTFKKFSHIDRVNVLDQIFKDPISSLRKLKLNKEIFENTTGLRNKLQIDSYLDIYQDVSERAIKSLQMRKVKETDLKTTLLGDEIGDVINPYDLLHEKNDSSTYNFHKHISREQVLNFNLEFFVNVNTDNKFKPWARSYFTLILDGSQLIMFGGISGEVLYQVWICDLKSNI